MVDTEIEVKTDIDEWETVLIIIVSRLKSIAKS